MKNSTYSLAALVIALAFQTYATAADPVAQPQLGTRGIPLLQSNNLHFKDLNRNHRLDPYEDWRLPASKRAADLVQRMSLERKCATMMHGTLAAGGNPMGLGANYDLAANEAKIHSGITSFITRVSAPPRSMAQQSNALQAIAERAELGIPLTVSSDPRNQIGSRIGMSSDAAGFSTWPDPLGFAAISDDALMREFGQLAGAEYRAVGIQMALSPQADLATEPRWSRIDGTFGEDPALVSRMVAAYVEGFQGSRTGLTPAGVATRYPITL